MPRDFCRSRTSARSSTTGPPYAAGDAIGLREERLRHARADRPEAQHAHTDHDDSVSFNRTGSGRGAVERAPRAAGRQPSRVDGGTSYYSQQIGPEPGSAGARSGPDLAGGVRAAGEWQALTGPRRLQGSG